MSSVGIIIHVTHEMPREEMTMREQAQALQRDLQRAETWATIPQRIRLGRSPEARA